MIKWLFITIIIITIVYYVSLTVQWLASPTKDLQALVRILAWAVIVYPTQLLIFFFWANR